MMRLSITIVALALSANVAVLNADGQGRGNSHSGKHAAGTHTTRTKVDAPKVTAKASRHTTKTEARAAKTITPTTPTTRPVKNPKLEARLQGMLPAGTTVQDAMTGFKNWGQFVAAVHVSNNLNIPFTDLKTKMTGLAPGTLPGTTVQETPMSLGQAIQTLKGAATVPDDGQLTTTKIRNEVKKAEDAATADLRQTRDRS
jgi:hypothetical protein